MLGNVLSSIFWIQDLIFPGSTKYFSFPLCLSSFIKLGKTLCNFIWGMIFCLGLSMDNKTYPGGHSAFRSSCKNVGRYYSLWFFYILSFKKNLPYRVCRFGHIKIQNNVQIKFVWFVYLQTVIKGASIVQFLQLFKIHMLCAHNFILVGWPREKLIFIGNWCTTHSHCT